ncbi:hypothetical protein VP01_422g1 [Puccinia sorghi]|uniref:Uncharacterized protein n=1 Tax=Puccinia sorghi TaxID=27349 RepID=A0A0L6UQI5_9BASI|nr:hypothetical protein VP01_422g1 [Puccinia sorghi]
MDMDRSIYTSLSTHTPTTPPSAPLPLPAPIEFLHPCTPNFHSMHCPNSTNPASAHSAQAPDPLVTQLTWFTLAVPSKPPKTNPLSLPQRIIRSECQKPQKYFPNPYDRFPTTTNPPIEGYKNPALPTTTFLPPSSLLPESQRILTLPHPTTIVLHSLQHHPNSVAPESALFLRPPLPKHPLEQPLSAQLSCYACLIPQIPLMATSTPLLNTFLCFFRPPHYTMLSAAAASPINTSKDWVCFLWDTAEMPQFEASLWRNCLTLRIEPKIFFFDALVKQSLPELHFVSSYSPCFWDSVVSLRDVFIVFFDLSSFNLRKKCLRWETCCAREAKEFVVSPLDTEVAPFNSSIAQRTRDSRRITTDELIEILFDERLR